MAGLSRIFFLHLLPPRSNSCVAMLENRLPEKGGEAVGWKRFRAAPLAVQIQKCQGYENVQFYTIADLP